MHWGYGRLVGGVALAASISACTEAPVTLDLQIHGDARIAVQDGDGPWQAVVPDATGRAEVEISSGRYGLAYLCRYSLSTWFDHQTMFLWSTAPDRRIVSCELPNIDYVKLSGATSPGARVFTENGSANVNASGSYWEYVRPGVHDVFAVLPGTPTRLLAERALEVTSDRVLDLPVATAGIDLPTMTPTVLNAAGPVTLYSDLNTATGAYVVFGTDATTVPVPPADLLVAGDQPAIGAEAGNCLAQQPLRTTPPTLELPGAFDAQLDRTMVTWHAAPQVAWEHVWFDLSAFVRSSDGRVTDIRVGGVMSREWLDAAGAVDTIPLPDLAALPGWQPEDAFTAGADVDWIVSVEQGHFASEYRSCRLRGTLRW